MLTAAYSVVNNTAVMQPLRRSRAISNVSPHSLPLFSFFCCIITDCSGKAKLDVKFLHPGYKNLPDHGHGASKEDQLLGCFISTLLELLGGNVGGRDGCVMAVFQVTP